MCAAFLLLGGGVLGACGGSDEKASRNGATDGGGSGGGGDGADASVGTGGSSGGSSGGASGTLGAGGGGAGGGAATCALGPCTGKTFMGVALDACCMTGSSACGITFGAAAGGQCFPASVLDNLPEGGGALGQAEPIVPDAACTAVTFNAPAGLGGDGGPITLGGCCDRSGICGVSTENFPKGIFQVPTLCLTPREAAQFGSALDGGAELPCSYPDGG